MTDNYCGHKTSGHTRCYAHKLRGKEWCRHHSPEQVEARKDARLERIIAADDRRRARESARG